MNRPSVRLARRVPLVVPLIMLTAAHGCGTEAPSPEGTPVWSAAESPLLAVGEQEGAPEYLFDDIRAVRLIGSGGVAVADRGSSSVRVYDAEGLVTATMGRAGEGPGEFTWLAHLELHPPDTLLAYDAGTFRISRYLLDGTWVGERTLRSDAGNAEVYVGTFTDGGAAVASLAPSPRGGTDILPDRMVVARFGPDGAHVAELGTLDGIRRAGGAAVVPFSPFLHAFVLHDSVFFTDGMDAAVHVLGADAPVRTFTVPIPSPDVAAAWAALRPALEQRDQAMWIEDLPAEVQAHPIPAVAEVMLDADARFWLKHYDPATDATHLRGDAMGGGRWSVVEPSGRLVATVDVPDGFVPMDAAGMRLAGVQRDALGVERVHVLRLAPADR